MMDEIDFLKNKAANKLVAIHGSYVPAEPS
jgi:hypothetical protein